ncbi:hypothetical protein [Neisseria sp. Ec49-e6-T10]|uniref:hypothetical protein n=1 Tax=Neisseria sp. Ec49-e6-T10 TaxID=3140744 RepID=UPI003EB7F287
MAPQQAEQQPSLLERSLPEPKRLNEINKLIHIFNVNEKLSIFKPKEQQTLMQAVGFIMKSIMSAYIGTVRIINS